MQASQPTRTQAFDQWIMLDDDNISTDIIKQRVIDLPQKMLLATHGLGDYYKLFFMSQTVQMVLGGLKPATSISIDVSLFQSYQNAGLVGQFDLDTLNHILFEFFSLRVTEASLGDSSIIRFYIYNPEAVAHVTSRVAVLYPYNVNDNIHTWISQCVEMGLSRDFVLGLVFGYPISSVKQYSKYMAGDYCRFDGRQLISSYGEQYYVWGSELKRDVKIREQVKDSFFTGLASQELYRDLQKELSEVAEPFRAISKDAFEQTIYSLKISRDLYT